MTELQGLRLYSRSLVLQFRLDFTLLFHGDARIKLKCVAKVNGVPLADKESIVSIYIPSIDQLNNEKLTNWKNSGEY